ncbi:hypothetical protein OS493_032784 [Desmophyllum pertusum]|uniref:Uncharacterized protein n=1 Tax=Desmophyllum pertusum TaxID=174260 RepID=A0A9W9ZL78_9CNID|nr:hypothetical protein OS493_032784 [Desmophyllum pertusum]
MTLKLTFAPVKKHVFRKRTAPGKFARVRRKIFAEHVEFVVRSEQEKEEVDEMGVRPLGLFASQEEVRSETAHVLPEATQVSPSQSGCPQVRPQESD